MSLTPAQRSLRARIAINSRMASPTYDPHEATRAANEARWERYFDEVDPTRTLSPEARLTKAKAAWRRDMDRAKLARSKRRR